MAKKNPKKQVDIIACRETTSFPVIFTDRLEDFNQSLKLLSIYFHFTADDSISIIHI